MDASVAVPALAEKTSKRWALAAWFAVFLVAALLAAADSWTGTLRGWTGNTPVIGYSTLTLLLLALACEFIDATIGMGYGTTLTPILIMLGFPVHWIIPAAVLSQFTGNITAMFFHHQVGNIDFLRDKKARNTGLVLGIVGLVVALVTVQFTVRVPSNTLKPLISLMVVAIGLFLLVGSRLKLQFRWRNVSILAAIAAFNKSFTGGGYGPLVAGGQVLVGLNARAAVATTALAEAIVCLSIAVGYLTAKIGIQMDILLPLAIGAMLSTPASALALNKLPNSVVRKVMGLAILLLGALSLLKVIKGV